MMTRSLVAATGLLTALALGAGPSLAQVAATPRASGATQPAAAAAGTSVATPVAPAAALPEPEQKAAPRANRTVLRLGVDDGRYRGFHQDGGDDPAAKSELRIGNPVQAETDRITSERRATRAAAQPLPAVPPAPAAPVVPAVPAPPVTR